MKTLFTIILLCCFYINSFSQSDDCVTATPITSSTICTSPIVGTTAGATQSMPGCSGTADDDVWYKFVATSSSHAISVQGSFNFDAVLEIFSGTCASLNSLSCNDNSSMGGVEVGQLNNLSIGSTYYIRVYEYFVGSGSGTFSICLTSGTPPMNDDCSNATPVSSSSLCISPTLGTSAWATQSMASACSGNPDDDVWYKFVATSVTHSLSVTGSSNYSSVVEVFSGNCASLSSMLCNSSAFSGGTSANHLTNLTIGNTYYFRVYNYDVGSGSDTFYVCLTNGSAPINDDCVNAISVTSSSSCVSPLAGTSSWASPSMSGCYGNPDDDVWYKFVATSVTHSLAVTGSSNYSPVIEVFSGNCASLNSFECNDNANIGGTVSSHLTNLIIGNTYYFRVYEYYAGSGSDTFTICLTDGVAPINDDCANAITVASSSICSAPIAGTTYWASQSMPGCSGMADDDVWYSFVASASSHSVIVTGSSNFAPVIEVFSGNCSSLTSLDCNSSASSGGTGSTHLTNLTIGNTYYFRVYNYYPGSGSNTFSVCIIDSPSPINDECTGAISVSTSTTQLCIAPLPGTSLYGTQSMPGCTGTADDDVWYSFIASANSHSIVVSPSTGFDAVLELFSGSCGSLVSMNCIDQAGSGGTEALHVGGLTIGNVYYFRVYDYHSSSSTNTFTICITTPTVLPPSNDDCSGAMTLSMTPNCLTTNTIVTSLGATESQSGCTGYADDDIWFSFVATSSKAVINATGDPSADAVIQLFSGNCSALSSLNCTDITYAGQTESLIQAGLTVGQTYYFRVYEYHNTGGATFTINVVKMELQATVSPSVNAICSGHSISLSASGTPTFTWSNGVLNGVAFTPTATTTYTVSGVGTGGCINTETVLVTVASAQTPSICMVTNDTANVYNEIYWDKYQYNNIDSMIVYRETTANIFTRIGSVDNLAYSGYVDTARHTGFRNGDPNIRSYKYKLQIRDTCGNYSAMSPYHTSLFLNNTAGLFTWDFYDIEGQSSPVNNYELYRDDYNSGTFNLIGTITATLGIPSYTFTDVNYATFAATARWGVLADGFSCNPSFRGNGVVSPMQQINKTKSNVKNNFTIPSPQPDPNPQGVREFNLDAYIQLMPNPANDFVTIASAFLLQKVNVYNNLGAIVQSHLCNSQIQLNMNVQDLTNGIYSVEIITQKGKIVKKLVISR